MQYNLLHCPSVSSLYSKLPQLCQKIADYCTQRTSVPTYLSVVDVHEEDGNGRVDSGYLAMFWLNMVQTLFSPEAPEQCAEHMVGQCVSLSISAKIWQISSVENKKMDSG